MSFPPADNDASAALIRMTQDDDFLRHMVRIEDLRSQDQKSVMIVLERLLAGFVYDLAAGLADRLTSREEDARFATGIVAIALIHAAVVCDLTNVRDESAVTEIVERAFGHMAAPYLRILPSDLPGLIVAARAMLRDSEVDLIREIRTLVENDLALVARGIPENRRATVAVPALILLTGLPFGIRPAGAGRRGY